MRLYLAPVHEKTERPVLGINGADNRTSDSDTVKSLELQ